MGTTIRRSVGDTDLLVYELRNRLVYEDRSAAVNLTGKNVYFTMVNSHTDVPDIDVSRQFASEIERDQYYTTYPERLINGLITSYTDELSIVYRIWRNDAWHSDYWTIISDKECSVVDAAKGYAGCSFTSEEVMKSGMFHAYFTVITPVYTTELIFDTTGERDEYFVENSDELIEGVKVAIDMVYYTYEDSVWVEGDAVGTISAKYPKGDSLWIHIMDVFTE